MYTSFDQTPGTPSGIPSERPRRRKTTLARLWLLILSIGAGAAFAYEEPAFRVIDSRDDYEIRLYEPYLVAETVVRGNFDSSGSRAFRILAGYIFGENRDVALDDRASVRMAMTVPVASHRSSDVDDAYHYWFVMERQYDRDTLPIPNDSRVHIREVEPRLVAVKTYSGRSNERNFERHLGKLRAELAGDGYEEIGAPQAAVYNGPFTLPFMRRNEVLIEVRKAI